MSAYQLFFDGTQLGDEVLFPQSVWEIGSAAGKKISLDPVVAIDDTPLGLAVYPRFRVRQKAADLWDFERWIFDLLAWADGQRRNLLVLTADGNLVADYGPAKLIALDRPAPQDAADARWSDEILLTFQTSSQPQFSS